MTNPPPPDLPAVRSLLFVCLGNICRSPLAEGLFKHHAALRGHPHRFTVESCGIGDWHVGDLPDPRTRATAQRRGLTLTSRARQVRPAPGGDFDRFDLILPMDAQNRAALFDLFTLTPGSPGARKIRLLREFDPTSRASGALEVPDPYAGDLDGFDRVHDIVERACLALLDDILR